MPRMPARPRGLSAAIRQVHLATDFLYNTNSREATASVGYDYMLRQCRLRGRIDSNGCVAAYLEVRPRTSARARRPRGLFVRGVCAPLAAGRSRAPAPALALARGAAAGEAERGGELAAVRGGGPREEGLQVWVWHDHRRVSRPAAGCLAVRGMRSGGSSAREGSRGAGGLPLLRRLLAAARTAGFASVAAARFGGRLLLKGGGLLRSAQRVARLPDQMRHPSCARAGRESSFSSLYATRRVA